MCWDKAAMKEERQQAYFDSILMSVSEAGGNLSRRSLIAQVKKDIKNMGNAPWHVDRMVATMIREGSLVRRGGRLFLNSHPQDQQNR